jgi:hypothetical protein
MAGGDRTVAGHSTFAADNLIQLMNRRYNPLPINVVNTDWGFDTDER